MFYCLNGLRRTPAGDRSPVRRLLSEVPPSAGAGFPPTRAARRAVPGHGGRGDAMNAPMVQPNYSILITDDDRDCREALREIMEPQGFRTFLASCGEEALDIVREEAVHLALLDMHMPTLTGLETLRMMRQMHELLPCILVTADATESLIRQAQQARAYSVIPKPVSKNVVL